MRHAHAHATAIWQHDSRTQKLPVFQIVLCARLISESEIIWADLHRCATDVSELVTREDRVAKRVLPEEAATEGRRLSVCSSSCAIRKMRQAQSFRHPTQVAALVRFIWSAVWWWRITITASLTHLEPIFVFGGRRDEWMQHLVQAEHIGLQRLQQIYKTVKIVIVLLVSPAMNVERHQPQRTRRREP